MARAAVAARQETERLAEELAEVVEEQRGHLEHLARDRRRTQRAEAGEVTDNKHSTDVESMVESTCQGLGWRVKG